MSLRAAADNLVEKVIIDGNKLSSIFKSSSA
jgi:hypothetical protein